MAMKLKCCRIVGQYDIVMWEAYICDMPIQKATVAGQSYDGD